MSLVLTRKEDETLILFTSTGEQIAVTVCRVDGRRVKLRIDAPESVGIMREELLEQNLTEKFSFLRSV